jgi:basic amino acid/polyamine antiporter, APA family
VGEHSEPLLIRGIGVRQATALNVTFIVGAGVFVTIPLMLGALPGPYALLGWLAAGVLIFFDGLIWSELGAALPGSGGSYQYLLECYGRDRWGRLFAFLFIWQFLVSGPLELGSGLVAIAQFSTALSPSFQEFNAAWTWKWLIWSGADPDNTLSMSFGPSRLLAFLIGVGIIVLLGRDITKLGRITVTFWIGVMGAIVWIVIEGAFRFDPNVAFDFSGAAASRPDLAAKLGPAMILAIYSYLGYYNVCYVGDEVRDPGRTIPRSIIASIAIVVILFLGLHLAMLGTVPWPQVPTNDDNFSLPAEFMRRIHGPWAATAITVLLVWCCIGSVFAGLLGYSRIPYGAARQGHFFRIFAHVHPREKIPHVSLWLVGAMMLAWSFFDLQVVINALIVTRILEQFVAQAIGVIIWRRARPDAPRPYRMWLYPLPCLIALIGWLYLYVSSGWLYIGLGAATLAAGLVVFVIWSARFR